MRVLSPSLLVPSGFRPAHSAMGRGGLALIKMEKTSFGTGLFCPTLLSFRDAHSAGPFPGLISPLPPSQKPGSILAWYSMNLACAYIILLGYLTLP